MMNKKNNSIGIFFKKNGMHIIFGLILIVIIYIIARLLWNWGTVVKSDYDPNNIENNDNYIEVLDNIVPHISAEGVEVIDDGVTTIVTFGNEPFADDRNSSDNLANIIAEKTGATVYNCAVPDSYLAASGRSLTKYIDRMDFFSFYWFVVSAIVDQDGHYQNWFEDYQNDLGVAPPQDYIDAYNTLQSIDFSTVDVIAIMYDGIDYYRDSLEYDGVEYSNVETTCGSLYAGIELLQTYFPHIRIIVMSPTYCYGLDEDGNYIDSELNYGYVPLSSYVGIIERVSHLRGVSFVDNYYGSINANNADQYLSNHRQLNKAGKELIADRFIYALNYFD